MSALSSFSAASSAMSSRDGDAAFGVDGAGNQRRGAAMIFACAGAHHAHARLAHQHAFDAERGQQRHIDPAQARAGQPQLQAGRGVGVRRQHAFAGRDRRERRRLGAAHLHGVERCDRIGAAGSASPVSTRDWRGRQRRRRVGAGIERRVGPHRIAVAQRQRRLGVALGDHRAGGKRQAQRLRHGFLARLDRPDRQVEACQHVGERGQPRNPLDFGIRNHAGNLT